MPPSPSTALVVLWSVLPAAVDPAVAIGARGDRVHAVLVGHGMRHAQWAEDALLQEGGEILARRAADDPGQRA